MTPGWITLLDADLIDVALRRSDTGRVRVWFPTGSDRCWLILGDSESRERALVLPGLTTAVPWADRLRLGEVALRVEVPALLEVVGVTGGRSRGSIAVELEPGPLWREVDLLLAGAEEQALFLAALGGHRGV